ncbi:ubiquitin activating enzyme, E1 family [Thraustotheca clavata]|uniref:NEDD8-activating enzyme E1 catalytic subunit n=1 Tax=Thraustotheca clavata TaxID=74557 RepID=A0A1V9Z7B3_9STRA|nr:ubiquitin activating enzyme, E1 family [Thraustotheca clavata]
MPLAKIRKTNMRSSRVPEERDWDLHRLLLRGTPFGNETNEAMGLGVFEPGMATVEFVRDEAKVLVLGAGGLGCEILKDLAFSGFKDIHVIDMDTIDISNLNRQFLFRRVDVGQPKALVAAKFVMERVKGVKVTPHHCDLRTFDSSFYSQFRLVISGLDNIDARRFVNSVLVSLVETDEDGDLDPSTIIPFIDGGTEGFKGQARVILPRLTSCFECSLDSFPPPTSFPMCTIAETPRQPAHCVAYASVILWEKEFPNVKMDTDSPDHMQWVYEKALERAEKYDIPGVTYAFTLGVVKNIIPAVASTNAIISAMCVNEALKAMSYCSQTMHNYHMHMGATGIYSHTFEYEKKPHCGVCATDTQVLKVHPNTLLQDVIVQITEAYRLKKPALMSESKSIFMPNPPALYEATKGNLEKAIGELLQDGQHLTITDPVFIGDVSLNLRIELDTSEH